MECLPICSMEQGHDRIRTLLTILCQDLRACSVPCNKDESYSLIQSSDLSTGGLGAPCKSLRVAPSRPHWNSCSWEKIGYTFSLFTLLKLLFLVQLIFRPNASHIFGTKTEPDWFLVQNFLALRICHLTHFTSYNHYWGDRPHKFIVTKVLSHLRPLQGPSISRQS